MAMGVGVIGLEHWYTAFGVIDTAAKSEVAPLKGIVELRPERLAAAQERYPEANVTGDLNSVLLRDDVDLIAICASTDKAPAIAKAALGAGKHVVSVKPPARTLAELDEVLAAAETAGRFYGSFEGMQRLNPSATVLRELIQNGEIGVPMSYHQVGHGGIPAPWPGETGDSWWLHAEKVPGGAWIDHAIYAVDLARFVFEGEITFATGVIENRLRIDISLEDYGASLMRLQPNNGGPGVTLLFEDTWTAQPGGGVHRRQIIGSAGNIRPDKNDWIVTKGSEETRHVVPESPFFRLDALVTILESGDALPFGPDDARANLAACLAVYENAEKAARPT
jgi:predicted dehydrogenase